MSPVEELTAVSRPHGGFWQGQFPPGMLTSKLPRPGPVRSGEVLSYGTGEPSGRLFHPAECAVVLRGHEDVSGPRIERGSAPICAAEPSREEKRAPRGSTLGVVQPWREGSGVVDAADLLDQVRAGLGVLGGRVCCGDEILRRVTNARERRWPHRERLRWKGQLAGDIALRYRALFDAEDRLAGLAIQEVQVTGLGRHGERGDGASVSHDVEQSWRRRRIGVPEIVMDGLEMPLVPAGLDVDGDDRITEQVCALPVTPVEKPAAGDARGRYRSSRCSSIVK